MTSRQESSILKKEYWRKHIENWQAGNVSQKKYCQQENISFSNFSWWRARGLKDKAKERKMIFVPAVIKKHEAVISQRNNDIQLVMPNQTKLTLSSTLPLNDLVSIIKSLGGLS